MLAAHRVLHAPRATANYDATILADGPVAFWPLNETSGTTATDTTGNGHSGSYVGTAGTNYTLGQAGIGDGETAVLFDGSAGYVDVATVPTTVTNTWSLEAWIKLSTTSGLGNDLLVVANGKDASPGAFGMGLSTGNMEVGPREVAAYSGGTAEEGLGAVVNDTSWHYIAIVCNGSGSTQAYLDGTATGSAKSQSYTVPTGSLFIAAYEQSSGTPYRVFPGTIAKAAIYNKALTATQISNHYAAK